MEHACRAALLHWSTAVMRCRQGWVSRLQAVVTSCAWRHFELAGVRVAG